MVIGVFSLLKRVIIACINIKFLLFGAIMGHVLFPDEKKIGDNVESIASSPHLKKFSKEEKENLISVLKNEEGENLSIIRFTKSLCPSCYEEEDWKNLTLPAVIYAKNGKVWMIKNCKKHGTVKELYWGDYDLYKKAEKYQDAGLEIDNPHIKKELSEINCPYDCGLCKEHESHTSLGNIALTNVCDLNCWYCFFYAKEGDDIYEPSREQIKEMLKAMKEEKPVGANAVQLSLERNEKITVRGRDKVVKTVAIGDFVDSLMKENEVKIKSDPIEHEFSSINDFEVLSVDSNNNPAFMPVSSVIRHKNEGNLFRLETSCGREITTTGAHSIFVLGSNGEIIPKQVSELTDNDILLAPLEVQSNPALKTINLINIIKEKNPNALEKIVVSGLVKNEISKYEKALGKKINWDSVPYSLYEKLKIGSEIRYFNSKKEKALPIEMNASSELLRLLGYYAGEGCCYKNGIIFSFGKHEEELIADFDNCVKAVFGDINVRKRENHGSSVQIYIEGFLYRLFFQVLGSGKNSREKAIPWVVYNVSDDLKKEFLTSYFKCDGNIKTRKSGFEINHNTVSKPMASDLAFLHAQLGIPVKIEKSISKPHLVEKTGQFIRKASLKYRVVIGGKENLSKALWYLNNEERRKFEEYLSAEEKHSPVYRRLPINMLELPKERTGLPAIDYLLKRVKHDKSLDKNNLMELTDYWRGANIGFAPALNSISHSKLGFFKIHKIKEIKGNKDFVYDISVPGSQAFFAGTGMLLAHNTGGEPTLRDDLVEIIKDAKEIGYDHIQLNTHGINLGKNLDLTYKVRDAGVNTIYMSFDGVSPETNPKNYWEAPKAIENCRKAGIGIVLVPTLIGGVNDHELGDIIRFGFGNIDVIRSVNFQPVSLVGRMPEKMRMKQRITIPGAIKRIEEQTDNQIGRESWFTIPCARHITDFVEALRGSRQYRLSTHFACGMATYVFKDGNKMLPITDFFDVPGFFEYLENLTDEIGQANVKSVAKTTSLAKLMLNITRFVDDERKPKSLQFSKILASALQGSNYNELGEFHKNSLFIGMMHFQDPYNWDVDRVHKCSIHYAMPNNTVVPFCTFNVIPALYRDKVQQEYSIPAEEWERKKGKKLKELLHKRNYTDEYKKEVNEFYKPYRKAVKKELEPDWGWGCSK